MTRLSLLILAVIPLTLAAPRSLAAPPGGWLARGAPGVVGAPVEVPLYRGTLGEGRPLVEARLPGDRQVLAVVDLLGRYARLGEDLAREAGIETRVTRIGGRPVRTAVIEELTVGELVVKRLRAEVVPGDELVIGARALGLSVGILPSEGVVRFAPGSRETPEGSVVRMVDGLVPVELAGEPARVQLRTDRTWSSVQPDRGEPLSAFDGLRRASLQVEIGQVALPPAVGLADGRLRDPGVAGVLGYDALATVDLVLTGDRVALNPASTPTWRDPAPVRLAEAEARYEAWKEDHAPRSGDAPPRMGFELAVSFPEGDPGDVQTRELFEALARTHWEAHDADKAVQHTLKASEVAGDHCLAHLELGERRLRTAGDRLDQAFVADLIRQPLQQAGELYAAWAALEPATRERVRRGQPVGGGVLAIEQPDRCGEAWGLLMGTSLALDQHERIEALYASRRAVHRSVPRMRGLALLDSDPAAAERHLREALRRGGQQDLDARLALAVAQQLQGRAEPVQALVKTVPWRQTDHPLITALIAAHLGGAPPPDVHPLPGVVAAHVVHAARGGEVPADQVEEVLRLLTVRQPGHAGIEALVATWRAVRGEPAEIPARAHLADTWAARAVSAALSGDTEAQNAALQQLRRRYPDIPSGYLGLGAIPAR